MGLKIGTCATCAFFHDVKNECRFNPPQVGQIVETSPYSDTIGSKTTSQWPIVDSNDWCGRYYDDRIKGQRKTYARQINDGDVVPVDIHTFLRNLAGDNSEVDND